MDQDRAKELLARERTEIEEELASISRAGPEEGDERVEPGDLNSEGLYQDELDAGRVQDLNARLAAVDRAETRLEAGTYGLSTISGEPIPDARLEAQPAAEVTVEEEERRPRSE
jgi:DnaK suppressor protein